LHFLNVADVGFLRCEIPRLYRAFEQGIRRRTPRQGQRSPLGLLEQRVAVFIAMPAIGEENIGKFANPVRADLATELEVAL